ncbi:MAG: leucine--tRNA ligase [Cellulomonadaceae bacterium]|nr:leucine--tRNA ligase [Cellulomonadaceae bacterium]
MTTINAPRDLSFRYTPAVAAELEQRWQDRWDERGTFYAANPVGEWTGPDGQSASAPGYFIMDMFPYPSGAGLHVGHPLGYIATDVVGRYRRMRGDNVLHAMGFDAFGLPAEQYAVQTGEHPRTVTEANIEVYKRQLRRLGLAHDPRRTFATIDSDYVGFTQWIFLQIFDSWYDDDARKARPIAELRGELNAGTRAVPGFPEGTAWATLTEEQQRDVLDSQRLAYVDESPVNWCPGLGTVLANEEVTADGKSERGNFPVFTKALRQWKMRITAYSDRLTEDLDLIDWPDKVKSMQRHWIGKSTGANVSFDVADDHGAPGGESLVVFTTRPDTLFGATFMVVAPEHALLDTVPATWPALPSSPSSSAEPATSSPSSCAEPAEQAESQDLAVAFGKAKPATPAPTATPAFIPPGFAETAEHYAERQASVQGTSTSAASFTGAAVTESPAASSQDEQENVSAIPASWTGGYATPTQAVAEYRKLAAGKTAVERQQDAGAKTGVFTGHYAINPLTGTLIPVFTADYVLMGYGTGAIMAVPGGDQRDYEFAEAYDLPVIYTVAPEGGLPADLAEAYTGDGIVVNSPGLNSPAANSPAAVNLTLNGMTVPEAKATTIAFLEANAIGESTTTYRLRDWLFSRQRYWGEPFPIVWDSQDRPVAVTQDMLPVDLPDVPDYAPRTFDPEDADSMPEAPLGRNDDWVHVTLDLGNGPQQYRRDTNTMPNWAGSCWYYLRYLGQDAFNPKLEAYWMGPHHNATSGDAGGADLYVGGVEHAVLHLLYARFWHKVLYDLGHVTAIEPFGRLFNQGYIQAYAFKDDRGQYVPAAEVEGDETTGFTYNGDPVTREYGKMGKSLKNVVTPDEMYEAYGADTFRLYEMSMGPLDLSRPWNTRDVVGSQRFLQRLWRNAVDEDSGALTVTDDAPSVETLRQVHRTISEVTTEMDAMRPNTAIAKLIALNNHLTGLSGVPRVAFEPLVLMTAPFAPHIAEELWEKLGHSDSLAYAPYPVADPQYLVEDTVTCVVQVKGKVRGRLEVPPSISDSDLQAQALAEPNVLKFIGDAPVRKVIVRAPGLVNIVV